MNREANLILRMLYLASGNVSFRLKRVLKTRDSLDWRTYLYHKDNTSIVIS